jgi:hypothetical protein
MVESVLKALWLLTGNTLPKARDFKVDVVIRELERLPRAATDDSIRLTIPRMCRAIYDVASNRGARHDPDEIDPNIMDASVAASVCSWLLAEMVRYSQRGSVDPSTAKALVDALSQKRFSFIEDVDGRVYFHIKNLGARGTALLALWRAHPRRLSKHELMSTIERHGYSEENARMSLVRLRPLVDEDEKGSWKLLLPGIAEAETLITNNSALTRSVL